MTDLSGIIDNGLCLGCGGCVAAIQASGLEMVTSPEGYLRPRSISLNPAQQQTLDAICAGRALIHDSTGDEYHELWGPIRKVATGYATDAKVRFRGSSGGLLSAIAIHLLEAGEIDFVLATSADPNDPIGNITMCRESRDGIIAAAGSRYAPSSPLADLENHLAAERRFAFIGKPCDVATLRRMAKRDPRIDALIPYKLSFFCAGIPSRQGTQELLNALSVKQEDVASFQYRGDGWPGLARAIRHDGTEESMTYEASWGKILNKHLQFRCKICPDGTGEFADVACADAWYGKDGYPDFEERDGRSLIVARTEAGVRLVEAAEAHGAIAVGLIAVDEIAQMQPYQVKRKRNVIARSAAVWAARWQGPRYDWFALSRLAAKTPLLELIRNFWGTFRRSRGKRLV